MKKPTLKDIAAAAGVSTATVSYILNNVQSQSIPEETRSRVLEHVKALGYIPNLAARSLVRQQTGLIGILLNRQQHTASHSWIQLRHAQFIEEVEVALGKLGYHIIVHSLDAEQPKLDIISERKLDAVIVVEPLKSQFHGISRHFPQGVPVVIVDSHINDPLFYQIVYDIEHAISKLEHKMIDVDSSYIVIDNYNCYEMVNHIINRLIAKLHIPLTQIHVMSDEQQLKQFISAHRDKQGIIVNEGIALLAAKYTQSERLSVLCTSGLSDLLPNDMNKIRFQQSKSTIILELLQSLMNKSLSHQMNNSSYTISIKAE